MGWIRTAAAVMALLAVGPTWAWAQEPPPEETPQEPEELVTPVRPQMPAPAVPGTPDSYVSGQSFDILPTSAGPESPREQVFSRITAGGPLYVLGNSLLAVGTGALAVATTVSLGALAAVLISPAEELQGVPPQYRMAVIGALAVAVPVLVVVTAGGALITLATAALTSRYAR